MTTYGELHSGVYDVLYPAPHPEAVPTLARLAGGGRALELGVGTGRVALPLAEAGVEVSGIDLSTEMLDVLRAKDVDSRVHVSARSMTDLDGLESDFDLVYAVGSTLYHLLSQAEQRRCLEAAARRLRPGGLLLLHGYLPDPERWQHGLVPRREGSREPTHCLLDASWHDPVTQRVSARLVYLHDGTFDVLPIEHRYVWPAELDLMAESAGLRLEERWDSWHRTPVRPGAGDVFHLYRR